MNDKGNLSSGGLVLRADDKLVITDLERYSGSFLYDQQEGRYLRLDGILWFMNHAVQYVYCSDQRRANRLCRLDLESRNLEIILDRPVYGLIHKEHWLYYINEEDKHLYRCHLNGDQESRLTKDAVISFVLYGQTIYYSTEQMIRSCTLAGEENERFIDFGAVGMHLIGSKLAFADRNKQYALTTADVSTGDIQVFGDIIPVSMNSNGRYLYCANRSNGNSIYRIDLEQGSKIRIYGDRADYLHIVGDELYFMNKQEWLRMSLFGGQALKAITLS